MQLGFFDPTARDAVALRHVLSYVSGASTVTAKRERDAIQGSSAEIQRLVLQTLFRDAVATNFWKDAAPDRSRLVLLRDELASALLSTSAVGILADALETADVNEQLFADVLASPHLKLSIANQVLFAVSQCYAANEGNRTLARKWLQKKLSEVVDVPSFDTFVNSLREERGDLVLRSLLLVTSLDPVAFQPFHKIAVQRLSAAEKTILPIGIEALIDNSSSSRSCVVPLAAIMEEIGPSCTATVDDAKELLTLYLGPIDPKAVAQCMIVMMTAPSRAADSSTWSNVRTAHENIGALPSKSSSNVNAASTTTTWSALNFAAAVTDFAPDIDWVEVLAQLDQPNCPADTHKLLIPLGAYRKVKNAAPPMSALIKPWTQAPAAQLQLLKALAANPDIVDRTSVPLLPASLLPQAGVTGVTDFTATWGHPAFVAALLDCGAIGGAPVMTAATTLVVAAAKVSPTAILASLITHPPSRTARGLKLAIEVLTLCGVSKALTDDCMGYIVSAGQLQVLLTMLSHYIAADHGRAASVLPLLTAHRLFDRILAVTTDPSTHVLLAVSGQELGQVPTNYIADALSAPSSGVSSASSPNVSNMPRGLSFSSSIPVSRVALAMAVVEVCDGLITKGASVSIAIRTALTAVVSSGLSPIIPSVMAHAKTLMSTAIAFGHDEEQEATVVFSKEIEDKAAAFVERICRGTEPDVTADVRALVRIREQGSELEIQLLRCITKTMLEEAGCTNQYPPSALTNFSRFFGQLIQWDLFTPPELKLALKIVLVSVVNPSDPRMREFGARALEVFKSRVVEWPAFRAKLRQAPDIDMYVPGIIALLNAADRDDANKSNGPQQGAADSSSTAAARDVNGKAGAHNYAGIHQHDIRTLVGDAPVVVTPSSVVQDRINFLVGNTDTDSEKTEMHAAELRSLLRPEFFPYFAEYLVVKRIALEPNNHKTYLALIDRLNAPELDTLIRKATIAASKRLLQSEKIVTNSSDRSLLKNLGSWLGHITLARNIPILARDIDLRELIPNALAEGKLIAVVPFIAKVIEHSLNSRAFQIHNPLIMCLLGQLAEMYRLDDLKITLRFEVEVLCRLLGIPINELIEYVKERPSRIVLDEVKQRYVNVQNSNDFRPSTDETETPPQQQQPLPRSTGGKGLAPDAAPYQPRSAAPDLTPMRAYRLGLREVITGRETERMALQPQYRQALHAAFDRGLQECQHLFERTAQIVCITARELVSKDFARDMDEHAMRGAAHALATSLASNLANATIRETSYNACRRAVAGVLESFVSPPELIPEYVDALIALNAASINVTVEEAVADLSGRLIDQELHVVLEHRRNTMMRGGDIYPPENISEAAAQVLNALPPFLRRGPLDTYHVALYHQIPHGLSDKSVDIVIQMLQHIEDAALRHYTECPPSASPAAILSLTNVSFTETTQSLHHESIKKKLIEVSQCITEYNAVPLLVNLFPRIMLLSEKVQADNRPTLPLHYANLLLYEVCLFLLQAIRERGQGKAVTELTKLYLAHEKRWFTSDLATNLIRLRVIDITEFDRVLSKALQEPTNARPTEFAGIIVQRCLIDEKIVMPKELKATIDILEKIAEISKRQRAPVKIHVPTAHPADLRAKVERYYTEWLSICDGTFKSTPAAPAEAPQKQQPSSGAESAQSQSQTVQTKQVVALTFVRKLQDEGMLKADFMLDKFFGIMTELVVEDYATQLIRIERERPQEQRDRQHNPDIQHGHVHPPSPRPTVPDPRLFIAVDAFSDLVIVLLKCCSWSQIRRADGRPEERQQGAAESALIIRVLQVVVRTLYYNHDFFVQEHPQPYTVPEGFTLQDQFMQQPYMRFFSNIMISLSTMQSNVAPDERPEYFFIIANALHTLHPQRVPGFAFAWIELVCHRLLVARCLKSSAGWSYYVKLLIDGLRFVEPFAKPREMTPTMILYFKCILKQMLMLLHDFSDFLMTYHLVLCDAVPTCCIQMRNIVLSAFPRDTKLPDPFARGVNFKTLPQIREPPSVASSVLNPFGQTFSGVICSLNKEDFDRFIRTKSPADIPEKVAFLVQQRAAPPQGTTVSSGFNVPMLSALIFYACLATLENQKAAIQGVSLKGEEMDVSLIFDKDFAAADLLIQLLARFNSEGRYHVINACVNNLRFPNSHTLFFSLAIQFLFRAAVAAQEHIQETITRVLVERLIISRPHPWGLLITFFDIVKDPKTEFWEKPFIRCTPEIERMFESVAQSVNTPQAAAQAAPPPPSNNTGAVASQRR